MRSIFRGLLRLSLAALVGALIAWPLRSWLSRSSSAAPVQAVDSAPSKPKADGAESDAPRRTDREPEPPYPTGIVIFGDQLLVSMSDKTVRYQHREDFENEVSDGVSQASHGSVVIAGKRQHFRPAPRPESAGVSQSVPVEPANASVSPASVQVGAWRLDPDGVYRLAAPSTIGKP